MSIKVLISLHINGMSTNLENMEDLRNSGNLKNCQNLRGNLGKMKKYGTLSLTKVHSVEFSSFELLREKF